jgi:hypothetical protein
MSDQVISGLAILTSGWRPGSSATPQDLVSARAALAASLASGRTVAEIDHGVTSRPIGEALPILPPSTAAHAIAYTQSALGITVENPLGVPAWATGMAQGRSFGPFVDPFGNDNVVVTIPVTQSRTITFGSVSAGFAAVPVMGSPTTATSLTLGPGSVWIKASLLDPTAPAGGFCGFRVSGGTLTSSAAVTLQSNAYVAPAGATLTLQARLAPPDAGTGTPGGDLTAASVGLPHTIAIQFTQTAATITALGDAHLQLYGSTVGITWPQRTPRALPNMPLMVVGGQPSTHSFAFASVKSADFVPAGTASITSAGWAMPIAITTIDALGESSGAGSLVLGLGAGATATCSTRSPAKIGGWAISIDPTALFVLIGGTGSASRTSYTLWPQRPPSKQHASVTWTNPAGLLASFLATPGHELLTLGGLATVYLDRPLSADGGAFPIGGAALLARAISAAGTFTTILGGTTNAAALGKYGIALENALIGVLAPKLFLVHGPTSGTAFNRANVGLLFDRMWLLPTLPDPYAANFDLPRFLDQERSRQGGLLTVGLGWRGTTDVTFGFLLGTSGAGAATGTPVHTEELTAQGYSVALLDLSTRVDLLGVALARDALGTVDVEPADARGFVGLNLAFPDTRVATFALPQFSWEPMQSTGPQAPLGPVRAEPATDGIPTTLRTMDPQQTLVPFAPEPVLIRHIHNVAAGGIFAADFSLPFGLLAHIRQPNEPPKAGQLPLFLNEGGAFDLVQPNFATQLKGAFQLTLKPPHPERPKAQFSGTTTVFTGPQSPGYGSRVLSDDVATAFQNAFGLIGGGAVPVKRIDLAGYGASIFSEWRNDNPLGPGIIKVHFDAVIGRTALEIVQAKSLLYPHGAPMVRTITIARQNAGWMQRTDTGWVPVAPGLFSFPNPAFTQDYVNRGAVAGVYNIRNVREFETVTSGIYEFRRVLFDADIGLDYRVKVTQGGSPSSETDYDGHTVTLVPARDLTGYLQIAPDEPASGPVPSNLNPAQADLAQLFGKVGAITDSFSCIAEIGGIAGHVGTSLRCSAIEIDMAPNPADATRPVLGAALRAAPVLPRDGAWGFGKRQGGSTTPVGLPGNFPVPIVQNRADPHNWHVADIADVARLATPQTLYGLLQDTGTQRVLFEQPIIKDLTGALPGAVPAIQLPSGLAPALADVGALLNATGLFPDIGKAISLVTGAIEELKTIPEGLHYTKTYNFSGSEPPTTLLDLGVLRVELFYKGKDSKTQTVKPTSISFNLDPAHTLPDSNGRNWWLTISPISFAVTVPEFSSDPLLTINGGFAADDRSKPGLTNLTIDYGTALDTLKSVFSKLQSLASFLPGGLGAGLDVSLSEGKLTVRDTFALPTLPLGLGELSDISLDLGLAITLSPLSADFIVGIGNPGNPFNWLLSPLAGNGAIDIGVQNGAPYFMIQGGIGLGLAINIGIAEGSASITLAAQITVNGSAITLLIILNGQASVDVLGGLASASLSLTAAVGVQVNPLPVPQISIAPPEVTFPPEDITFIAEVAVGIHISICWVVSIDFEGSWEFQQSMHTPQLTVGM